ncbi:transcriptional regulator [Bacteroides faecium]|uniref:Transcriptional regulator n=1 Tax=Bacteroides faecium TaxID=2715212 RepID=A0A6H0KRF9_9BACE|nr:transcriptional regulator [Bacteroides faecium]QIU95098.1 transcriptional regulator [Bacteroides faecium]
MKVGDKVLVSPDLTMLADWTPATVIEVENNPFIGIVISAKTDKGVIFFGQKDLFKPLKEEECLQ